MNVLAAIPSSLAAADQPTLENFGHDVWWIVLIKVVGIFVVLVVMTLFAIVFERKVVARMQQRIGPNRVGPKGLFQAIADVVKLLMKEDIVPKNANRRIHDLAPIISIGVAMSTFAVIPIGGSIEVFGYSMRLMIRQPAGRSWSRKARPDSI